MTKEKKREVVHTGKFKGPMELVAFEGYSDFGDKGWFVGERYYYASRWCLSTMFWCHCRESALDLMDGVSEEYAEVGRYLG